MLPYDETIDFSTFQQTYSPFKGVSSGSLVIDRAIGLGIGYPRGQITQIIGDEGSGKTTLCILAGATAVAAKQKVLVLAMERRWNVLQSYRSGMGMPGTHYTLASPETAEDALNYLPYFAEQGYDLAVLDSVAAMSPRAEFEGDIDDKSYAGLAKVMSQWFRMRLTYIARSNMAVLMTNQYRTNIGITYGNPNTYPGGNAMKYYPSINLELDRANKERTIHAPNASKEEKSNRENPIGFTIHGKAVKNSVAPPYRPIDTDIYFKDGFAFNIAKELIELGPEYGIFTGKSGGRPGHWYYHGEFMSETSEGMKAKIVEDEGFREQLILETREAIRSAETGQ